MRVAAGEFIRRFLLHVLPDGFHRIRHYGLFANGHRAEKLDLCRQLLGLLSSPSEPDDQDHDAELHVDDQLHPCPCCGGRMKVVEILECSRPLRRHARKFGRL